MRPVVASMLALVLIAARPGLGSPLPRGQCQELVGKLKPGSRVELRLRTGEHWKGKFVELRPGEVCLANVQIQQAGARERRMRAACAAWEQLEVLRVERSRRLWRWILPIAGAAAVTVFGWLPYMFETELYGFWKIAGLAAVTTGPTMVVGYFVGRKLDRRKQELVCEAGPAQ